MSEINIHKGTATIFHDSGKPYTSISNEVVSTIRNTDALAIWAFLQSKSNDWTVIGTFLMSHFNLGRKRYSDAMRCLKDLGLIEYRINRDDSGKIIGNKIIVMYEFKASPIPTETDMSVNPQSGEPALPLKAPLPIKDSITHEGLDNKEPLSGKPDVATKLADARIAEIFDFWKAVMKSPRSKLDAKRKSAIAKALKDYSAEELRQAIIGCSKTSWNMGENPGGKLYNQITLIFRDSDRIERFIAAADDDFTGRNKNAHKAQRTQAHTHGEKLQHEYRRFLNGHETAVQNNQRFLAKNDCNIQPGLVEYDDDVGF